MKSKRTLSAELSDDQLDTISAGTSGAAWAGVGAQDGRFLGEEPIYYAVAKRDKQAEAGAPGITLQTDTGEIL